MLDMSVHICVPFEFGVSLDMLDMSVCVCSVRVWHVFSYARHERMDVFRSSLAYMLDMSVCMCSVRVCHVLRYARHERVYVCMYVCMYVCVYVCICVDIA